MIGDYHLKKIKPIICQKLIDKLYLKYKSANKMKSYVNAVFDYGVLMDIIEYNPMASIRTPPLKRNLNKDSKKEKPFYSKEELKYFFECLAKLGNFRDYVFFRVLAFTGGRKGEVLALNWADIDFSEKTIYFNKTLEELQSSELIINPPKNDASYRAVPVDNRTLQILHKWKNIQTQRKLAFGIRENDDEAIVFSNLVLSRERKYLYKNYPNSVMNRVFRQFPKVRKIKIHGFRHTHASLLFEAGEDIKVVQKRLGHASIQTTMDIYTHVSQEKIKDSGESFANYVAF